MEKKNEIKIKNMENKEKKNVIKLNFSSFHKKNIYWKIGKKNLLAHREKIFDLF